MIPAGVSAVFPYEKLDAWKVCQELVLALYKETEDLEERHAAVVNRMRYLAFRAAGKLAFGSAVGRRKMLRLSAERTVAYLTELNYELATAEVTGTLPREKFERLTALCGRANFYAWKLVLPQELPPEPPLPPPPDDADVE